MKKKAYKKEGAVMLGRITRGGQTTIPQEIRESFGLEEGSLVSFEQEGGFVKIRRVEIVPAKRRS